MYDLHTHSLASDGELLPIELVRRASVLGYTLLGITDHVDSTNISSVVASLLNVKNDAAKYGVKVLCGVEITHVPPDSIAALARRARDEGAEIVIVHGETTSEPVAEGTNLAACSCEDVDVLAHPGFLTTREAELARENDVAIEITGRCGHNRTNGHVFLVARAAGCRIVVDSDAHAPSDLMTEEMRYAVARGAGMTEEECEIVLAQNWEKLLKSG